MRGKKEKLSWSVNFLAASLHPNTHENDPKFNKLKNKYSMMIGHDEFKKDTIKVRQTLYLKLCDYTWHYSRFQNILGQ